MLNRVFRIVAVTALLAGMTGVLRAQPERHFTRDDTLRGTITPQREWWDVTYYHLAIRVQPDSQFIAGSLRMDYRVLKPGNTLQIDLQPPMRMNKVTQSGRPLRVTRAGENAWFVALEEEQRPGAVATLEIEYAGHPRIARNPPWDGGFQFATDSAGNPFIATSCQGLGASVWWPNKDHSADEPDSMAISITVPEPLTDVSNGRLRGVVDNGDGTRTFHWFVSNPINNYGVNVNVATYAHFADTLNGKGGVLDLDYYVLPANVSKAKEHFGQAKLMLRAFEHWFGPYPFYEDGYKLVETPYLGMEHQSSVTYGNGYQNGYRGRDLSGTGWGLKWDFIIVHESGHEWFANNITYKDIADMWIHESFTNYSESLFVEYYYGREAAIDYIVGTRRGIQNKSPIVGVYGVNEPGSGDMYPKGGNMIHTIRSAIGNDSLFRSVLLGLNETFRHQTVTGRQVEEFISQRSGLDLSAVFDQYLRNVSVPRFEYYVRKKRLYYRWTGAVPGFNLRVRPAASAEWITPSLEWKNVSLKEVGSPVDEDYLKRRYYIEVKRTGA